jgi:hypothetical protein
MFYANVIDLESSILEAVRASPDGISKQDIIKQLFTQDPEYVEKAFQYATDEEVNEIIPVVLENGEEGYKINPKYFQEDD